MAGGREPHELIRALLEEEERERKERAVGEQQQKEGAARRQRGTRGTRASFGGAVAKLALGTPANIGALHSGVHALCLRVEIMHIVFFCGIHSSNSRARFCTRLSAGPSVCPSEGTVKDVF